MKVLIAHNRYQHAGGEDVVFSQESSMLSEAGIDVKQFRVDNDNITGLVPKIVAAATIIKRPDSVARFRYELSTFKPDIVHVHNFFPTLSPFVIEVALKAGCPVFLTLHNYRLICANALLMRDGKVCEDCIGGSKTPGILHSCYRHSMLGSAVVGLLGPYVKRLLKQYPTLFKLIALTKFAKSRFVLDAFPGDSIIVRGNHISDPCIPLLARERRIVFVGRLSSEKGVSTLMNAARGFDGDVEVIGDGPERNDLERRAPGNVRFLGALSHQDVMMRIASSAALALPSQWNEGFPMVILEAMAMATPVLASNIGGLGEIVIEGETGHLLTVGDESAWRKGMSLFCERPDYAKKVGDAGRRRFIDNYSAVEGTKSLIEIYSRASQLL